MKEAQLGTGREREKLAFIDCLSVWSTGEYSFFFFKLFSNILECKCYYLDFKDEEFEAWSC